MADDFTKALGDGDDGLRELASRVPRLKFIRQRNEKLTTVIRNLDGTVELLHDAEYLDRSENYDWMTFEVDWRHRPMSRRMIRQLEG